MGLFGSMFNTVLPADKEKAFLEWAAKAKRENDTEDYDLRGAFLSNAQQASNGHLPDTFKKPNHPTFSDESQYSTPQNPGGHWGDAGNGQWNFWASPANLQYRDVQGLLDYFKQREPNATVFLPSNYRLPPGR